MAECLSDPKRARRENDPANDTWSSGRLLNTSDLPQSNGKIGPDYIKWVLKLVSQYRHSTCQLKSPDGATWRIGDLEDTMYSEEEDEEEVDGWGKFYLPQSVKMQVIGVVEGTTCPCDELVLMTCEDKKVYAYDGEKMHEVAPDIKHMCEKGIKYPASKIYFDGDAFQHMTQEDWDEVNRTEEGQRLDKEHHDLVLSMKSSFLDNLRTVRHQTVSGVS